MEKVKLFIILSVAVLSALAVGAVLINIFKDDGSRDLINGVQGGQAQTDEQPAAVESGTQAAVTIQNYAFGPSRITIKKGTTVTWTNRDVEEHDVTPDNPSGSWQQSSLLGRGDSYSVTFDEIGTYTYFCSPHPEMTGSITVVD